MGQHQQHVLAQGAGDVRRGVADGDDEVAGIDQCGKAVDVFPVVDRGDAGDVDAGVAPDGGARGVRIAVLQVDKTQTRCCQQRRQQIQRQGFLDAEFGVTAVPRQTDDTLAFRSDFRTQRCGARGIGFQVGLALAQEVVGGSAEKTAEFAERNLPVEIVFGDRGFKGDDAAFGEGTPEQRMQFLLEDQRQFADARARVVQDGTVEHLFADALFGPYQQRIPVRRAVPERRVECAGHAVRQVVFAASLAVAVPERPFAQIVGSDLALFPAPRILIPPAFEVAAGQ